MGADIGFSGRAPLPRPLGGLTLGVIVGQLPVVAVIARLAEDARLLLHVAAVEIILPAKTIDVIAIMIDVTVIALGVQRIET